MSSEESLETRQKNEFEALEAIYGEDLKDFRGKPVWNKWVPLNLSLSLTPQQGSSRSEEINAKIDLHVICSENYPNSVPKILLENNKGLSNILLVELKEALDQKAEELKGEEMIFQLSQYVEEFLHRHNKPPSKSFYDEMLEIQRKKKLEDLQTKKLKQDEQRQTIIEEIKIRQKILKSEAKLIRETRHISENNEDVEVNRKCSPGTRNRNVATQENGNEFLCQHNGTTVIHFGNRKIQRGRCIKHSSANHVVFNGIDNESGEFVVVSEWIIDTKNKNDLTYIQRQINSIEQEMNYLVKLKHSNLAHYYNLKYETNDNNIIVYLLKEFVYGSTCSSLYLSQNRKIDTDFLKHIARGILTGLDYLHRNNVVHKDVKDTNIYINDDGIVKVSNYSIYRRLLDLISQTPGTYNKKTDIYNFGKVMLTLVQGSSIAGENFEIPESIQSDLYDFLKRCLAKEESDRPTTTQLLNHAFICAKIPFPPQDADQEEPVVRNVSPVDAFPDLEVFLHVKTSRIVREFEILQHLGKGAFGDVLKVRNNLDGGYYAIKRIQLDPRKKILNKKIVREAKLLSRLNHENVVRYYNSWIEKAIIKVDEEAESNLNSPSVKQNIPKIVRPDEFTLSDNIEPLAPSLKNIEISIAYDSKSNKQAAVGEICDDDSSDDEDDGAFGGGYVGEIDSEESVVFVNDSNEPNCPDEESSDSDSDVSIQTEENTEVVQNVKQIYCMYIQMEFCEKSTLRTAIDNNLYLNEDRLRRLFREIVEGLAHIHQQGMIHRDLKPANLFLDSSDHVKIGDFGLATTSLKPHQNEYVSSKSPVNNQGEEVVDEAKTGLVGTTLYVAPEIDRGIKAVYNQKVDIYSLGIILFEMCHKPIATYMEKHEILSKLRSKEVVFPEDFVTKKNEKHVVVIRWLLNHDASKRPTSKELLRSEYIPPVVEERSLRELVRTTLSNPQLKAYKYLIATCFEQFLTPAQDITYDRDSASAPNILKPLQLYDFVKETCIMIFKQHGGQNLSTPLLLPKCKFYEGFESCVKLMTHFGSVVSLPHDLRVPFARYVAWNGISLFRRYSVERAYREKRVFGFQPREFYECAFDIVTPTSANLMADAEVLYIVYEIFKELPGVRNKSFQIKLNHASLLKAILLHCGIKDKHQEVFNKLSGVKEGKVTKIQLQNYFATLGLSDHLINNAINYFTSDFEVSKVKSSFQWITKKNTEAGKLARESLQELKAINKNAENYGIQFDILISPGLVYNVHHYSGMICQFVCELENKRHNQMNKEVLAAGGRYDSMIASYRSTLEQANLVSKGMRQSAVGISISLDRLVQIVQMEESSELPNLDVLDAVVCSLGTRNLIDEKIRILKNLWAAGIRCALIEANNLEEIQEQQNEMKASHVIMLKDNGKDSVIVQSKYQEKLISTTTLVEHMQKILKNSNEGYQKNVQSPFALSRSESRTLSLDRTEHSQEPNVGILFVTMDKFSSNSRKRYENQMRSQLADLFKKLSGHVMVLGVTIEPNLIRSLGSYLEFQSEHQFQLTVSNILERHPKHKKYLSIICDEIYDQKNRRTKPTIVLYGVPDNFFKVIF